MGAKIPQQKIDTMKRLLADGKSYRQIAREVELSVNTVFFYLNPKVRMWRKRYERRPERVERFERFIASKSDATALNTPQGIILVNTRGHPI